MSNRATVHHYACDTSEWSFTVSTSSREVVAQMYHRGQPYGPEFRGDDQAQVQRQMARWLLLHADDAAGFC